MTLIDYLKANVPAAVLATHDPVAISAAAPARVEQVKTAIGAGTIITVLGTGPGGGGQILRKLRTDDVPTALLPYVDDFSEMLRVIDRGDFDCGAPGSRGMFDALFAGGMITSAQCAALKAIGENPVSVTEYDVRCALWDAAGNWLGG